MKLHLVPKTTQDYTIDALRKEFKEELRRKTCITCASFNMKFGDYPVCLGNTSSHNEIGLLEDKVSLGPWCEKRHTTRWWNVHPKFTLAHFIQQNQELNDYKETDYYEVYQHFTGGTRKVPDGWFKTKLLQESFFYILKNGEGFYCTEYIREKVEGFVPLSDFQESPGIDLIKRYNTSEEAIKQCEIFNSWGNKKGNLVYSTLDPLESRFKDLEKT